MPLDPGAPIGEDIKELHQGPNYAKTKARHGKAVADRQAIAIAEKTKRQGRKRKAPKKSTFDGLS